MDKILTALLFIFIFSSTQAAPIIKDFGHTQVIMGSSTAEFLNALYNRQFPNCHNSDSMPAFLCSGVVLRVTTKDPAGTYKVWDPSPTSQATGGVSFSYLRADSNFGILAWGNTNGYILYPAFSAPAGKIKLEYLCSYPMDAHGWRRSLKEVCGPHPEYPTQSVSCQVAGVSTAQQWLAVWKSPGVNPNIRQCGFDVRDERNQLAGPAFYSSLQAKTLLGAEGFNQWNEVIIKRWGPGQPNTYPIMAFFYIPGNSSVALADAQYNQLDFYNSTQPKISVPIIRLRPGVSPTDLAKFYFDPADQAVQLPD